MLLFALNSAPQIFPRKKKISGGRYFQKIECPPSLQSPKSSDSKMQLSSKLKLHALLTVSRNLINNPEVACNPLPPVMNFSPSSMIIPLLKTSIIKNSSNNPSDSQILKLLITLVKALRAECRVRFSAQHFIRGEVRAQATVQ